MQALNINLPGYEARRGYVLSFLARYIPGSVWGYISRSEWLWQSHRVAYKLSNYISVLEILLDFLSNLLAFGICVILSAMDKIYFLPMFLLIIISLIVWITFPDYILPHAYRLFFPKSQEQLPHPMLRSYRWFLPLILRIMNWFIYGLALFLVGLAFGTWPIHQLFPNLIQLTKNYCLAWLIGYVIVFLPSGLGAREIVLSTQLKNQFQLASGVASGLSITMRLITTIAEFACIPLVLLLEQRALKRGKYQEKRNNK